MQRSKRPREIDLNKEEDSEESESEDVVEQGIAKQVNSSTPTTPHSSELVSSEEPEIKRRAALPPEVNDDNVIKLVYEYTKKIYGTDPKFTDISVNNAEDQVNRVYTCVVEIYNDEGKLVSKGKGFGPNKRYAKREASYAVLPSIHAILSRLRQKEKQTAKSLTVFSGLQQQCNKWFKKQLAVKAYLHNFEPQKNIRDYECTVMFEWKGEVLTATAVSETKKQAKEEAAKLFVDRHTNKMKQWFQELQLPAISQTTSLQIPAHKSNAEQIKREVEQRERQKLMMEKEFCQDTYTELSKLAQVYCKANPETEYDNISSDSFKATVKVPHPTDSGKSVVGKAYGNNKRSARVNASLIALRELKKQIEKIEEEKKQMKTHYEKKQDSPLATEGSSSLSSESSACFSAEVISNTLSPAARALLDEVVEIDTSGANVVHELYTLVSMRHKVQPACYCELDKEHSTATVAVFKAKFEIEDYPGHEGVGYGLSKKKAKEQAAAKLLKALQEANLYSAEKRTSSVTVKKNFNQIYDLLPIEPRSYMYKILLVAFHSLKENDKAELYKRGLPVSLCDELLFRSWGPRTLTSNTSTLETSVRCQHWAQKLKELGFEMKGDLFDTRLAGIGNNGRDTVGVPGIFIPAYDHMRNITGAQIKTKKEKGKYMWLSSRIFNGNPCHLPNNDTPIFCWMHEAIFSHPAPPEPQYRFMEELTSQKTILGVCEGGLKSLISAYKLQIPFIGCGGYDFVRSSASVLEAIRAVRPDEIIFFPDAGSAENVSISESYFKFFIMLTSEAYNLKIAWWNQKTREDSDIDELSSGETVHLLTMEEFIQRCLGSEVREALKSSTWFVPALMEALKLKQRKLENKTQEEMAVTQS